MAASMALAGVQGCSQAPPETILPYVRQPEQITPGLPLYFATAVPAVDGALGVVATSHMGRPTKLEGNKLHPASLGATSAQAQASVLTLYDPDRSQTVVRLGVISTWSEFLGAVRTAIESSGDGTGLRILSSSITSPTTARQRAALLAAHPAAVWHQWDAVGRDNARRGAEMAFGQDVCPIYRLETADRLLAIDADFLSQGGAAVRYARDFMSRRGAESQGDANRLYVVESAYSPTGAAADHRLPLAPSDIDAFMQKLAARLGVAGVSSDKSLGDGDKWLEAVASDLESSPGRSVVFVGDHLPARTHALAHAINDKLGAAGATLDYVAPIPADPVDTAESLSALVDALNSGAVKTLLILDVNPVYDAPPDLAFAQALRKAEQSMHFGLYQDETAELCHWHVPAAHFLESWSDARAYDGAAAIVQPLIAPLYEGKTVHEALSAFVDATPQASYDLVRATWQQEFGDQFEAQWHASLRDGLIPGSRPAAVTANLSGAQLAGEEQPAGGAGGDAGQIEIVLRPDPSIGDGRLANNAWLQELPKALTKLTWENAILISPALAERMALTTDDVAELRVGDRSITAPVCVVPGHADGCATCHFGYGRTRAGRVGSNIGFNAYRLRTATRGDIVRGGQLVKTAGRSPLARTQKHHEIDGRNIVHQATVAEWKADAGSVRPEAMRHELETLYPEDSYEGFAWGMAIDLSRCMGCNACVVACQAENNIPVVGKEGVMRSREMHWLRMDVYYAGSPQDPQAIHQPMLCQHCEKAPCEVVCPVAATTHSEEGLNEMTYNRCIGTRYCSNNCPYKVRRFNFFQYQDEETPVLKLLRNPDVTVRSRGVMEKCTYCVQRINHARMDAKKAALETGGQPTIADGSLETACQQACPAEAIVFGDINDPASRVARLKADSRNYGALVELGTRPRTTYLVRLRNPNPQLG
jgi:molybdopterin-containing oxidoreductase family iron-sulfur binding subunit